MSKNKNSPEQCSLRNPIERPKSPTIKVDCSCYQCKDHQDIPENKTQRPPWVLDPTVFGNGSSDLSYLKWWRRTWVKVIFLANPINTTIGEVTWCLHFLKNRFLHWRDLVWFEIFVCRPLQFQKGTGRLCWTLPYGEGLRVGEWVFTGFCALYLQNKGCDTHVRGETENLSFSGWMHPSLSCVWTELVTLTNIHITWAITCTFL